MALPPSPVADGEAEAQPCPRCGAEPDRPCRTATTGDPTDPHAARRALALTARAYPDPPADPDTIPPWGTPPR